MKPALVSKADVPAIIGTQFGGGFFAGLFHAEGKKFAIVTAPKAEGEHSDAPWNDTYSMVDGALSFLDGLANTQAMADAGIRLAQWALGLRIGGVDDWHIPAQDVKEVIYRNLKPTTEKNWCYARSGINLSAAEPTRPYQPDFPVQTLSDAFKQGGTEAFDPVNYWTSTRHASSSDYAWGQNFGNGNQLISYRKDSYYRARAVRILEIQ